MKNKLYIISLIILLNIGKSYSQTVITTSIEKVLLTQLKDVNIKSKLSDKIVVEDFKKLLKKPNKSSSELKFLSGIIIDVFPKLINDNVIEFIDSLSNDKKLIITKIFKSKKITLTQKVDYLKSIGFKNANELTAQVWTDVTKKY